MEIESTCEPAIPEFSQLSLRQDLLEALQSSGYLLPSQIQSLFIKPIIDGRDVAFGAQKDTGKTSIFIIGLLQIIDLDIQKCQGLIITASQEQAKNTRKIIQTLGKHLKVSSQIYTEALQEDIQDVQIIIGALEEIYRGLQKKAMNMKHLKLLVLDEVGMEFSLELKEICRMKPRGCQMGICFEEMSQGMEKIVKDYMEMPAGLVRLYEEFVLSRRKRHFYILIDKEEWKYETLVDLYQEMDSQRCVVFCKDENVQWLVKKMNEEAKVIALGMDKSINQEQKEIILEEFGSYREIKMLITNDWLLNRNRRETDQMEIFIHYDFPKSAEKYAYRVKKGGKFGGRFISISFVSRSDLKVMKDIENCYGTELRELPMNLKDLF